MLFSNKFLENPPTAWHVDKMPPSTTCVYFRSHVWEITGLAYRIGGELLWEAMQIA